MSIRPVGLAILTAAAIAAAASCPSVCAEPGQDEEFPAHIASLLSPSIPKTITDCGFLATRQMFLDAFSESETTYFLGFSASLMMMDGGPNIDNNAYLSNSYTDALNKTGVGGMLSLDVRMISDIYLRFETGVVSFSSGGTIMDNIGRKYEIEPFSQLFAAIGGTYSFPVLMLGDEQDRATDLRGLQLIAKGTIGMKYAMDSDAQVSVDPTGRYASGDKMPFWHDSVGAYFRFVIGAEFKVDIFSAFVEIGFNVFEQPRSATHPREYGRSEVVITYPITLGFSMRL